MMLLSPRKTAIHAVPKKIIKAILAINHISIDNKYKLIRCFEATSAEVHDSQNFIDVLSENTSQNAYVDSAYGSEEY